MVTANYEPQDGDEVEVLLRGKVSVGGRRFSFHISDGDDSHGNVIYPGESHVVSIRKVEPPVVVFKPGDLVRHKGDTRPIFVSPYERNGYTSEFYERAEVTWPSDKDGE